MNPNFPTVSAYPLPEQALRAPLRAAESPAVTADSSTDVPDSSALSEALTPLISAAIARRARQRRYTP